MTAFYRFDSEAAFVAAGGKAQAEYTRQDGVGVSVLGDFFEPEPDPLPEDYQPALVGFLVNTTKPVEDWAAALVAPASPMRIFG